MKDMSRLFFWLAISFFVVGALLHYAPNIPWLGKLPGDIRIERPGFTFIFPLATCVILSIVLTLIATLFSRR